MIRVPEVPAFALGLLMLASTSRIVSAQETSFKYHRSIELSAVKIEKSIAHIKVLTTCDDGDGIGEARLSIDGGVPGLTLQAENDDQTIKGEELTLPSGVSYLVSLRQSGNVKGSWPFISYCYSNAEMEDAIRSNAHKGGYSQEEIDGFIEQRREARRLLLNPVSIEPVEEPEQEDETSIL